MKLLSKVHFSSLMACLIFGLLISCQKQETLAPQDDNVITPKLVELRNELQNHAAYIDLQVSNNLFFNQLRNNEIELFKINDYIKKSNENFNCEVITDISVDLVGFDKYREAVCSKKRAFLEITEVFQEINNLETHQLRYVFTPTQRSLSVRGDTADCLDMFQIEWAILDVSGLSGQDLFDEQSDTIDWYNKCCENGGGGCP